MDYDLLQYDLNTIVQSDVVSDMVKKIGSPALDALSDSINDIQELIASRQELHDDIMSDLNKAEIQLDGFIEQIMTGRRRDETALKDIATLKAKSVDIGQARKQEKLDCWQDIAKLKEELRQMQRELHEKESRSNLLDSILNTK